MRIRSTKPEFWRSARIASVSWDARLVLKGLESYVDDNGVGKDDIALIVSDVFPRDLARESPGTLRRVTEAIDELHHAGLVHRYETELGNCLYVSWWEEVQYVNKPNKGRYPRPDGTMDYKSSSIKGSFQKFPGKPGKTPVGTGEQGIRGTGESSSPTRSDTSLVAIAGDSRGARAVDIVLSTAHSPDAHRIAVAYSQSLESACDGKTLSEIAVEIDGLLSANLPPEQIAAGLKAWHQSDSFSPTQIRRFVHKANKSKASGVGKPTTKAVGHLSVAEQIIAEMEAS